MKYLAMSSRPKKRFYLSLNDNGRLYVNFQIHVNEKHLAGLLLILLGVILLQFI